MLQAGALDARVVSYGEAFEIDEHHCGPKLGLELLEGLLDVGAHVCGGDGVLGVEVWGIGSLG